MFACRRFIANAGTGWNVATAVFARSLSIATEETDPRAIRFKPDGRKMYVLGRGGDDVSEYSLGTAWDLSTASYVQAKSISAQEVDPTGLFFKPDGTKMYVTGFAGSDVNEYNLSTAWDVSTATYSQVKSVSTQDTVPNDIFFRDDGLKMYMIGNDGDDVNEYNLSTAWDISTATYLQNFSVATQENIPQDVFFRPDGLRMYVLGNAGDDVNEYSLSTAWNISTASYVQVFSVAGKETTPTGMHFSPDGRKLYIIGVDSDSVHEYDVSNT